MLMKLLRDNYLEMMGQFEQENPVSTIPARQPAANAATFVKSEAKSKRRGRARYLNRSVSHNRGGWTVRTW